MTEEGTGSLERAGAIFRLAGLLGNFILVLAIVMVVIVLNVFWLVGFIVALVMKKKYNIKSSIPTIFSWVYVVANDRHTK